MSHIAYIQTHIFIYVEQWKKYFQKTHTVWQSHWMDDTCNHYWTM